MSNTDNWIKLYQHFKSHFISSTLMTDRNLLHRRPSLISFRSPNNSGLIKIKKRASYGEIDGRQYGYNDFRHVRDSLRAKNPHLIRMTSTITNNKRRPFRKSTTCDIPSEDISLNETKSLPLKTKPMNKPRNQSRRFSLVKFELPSFHSNNTKDEHKSSVSSASPNLIQKLLFRQFNHKTRPYSMGMSVDDSVSTATIHEITPNRQRPSPINPKQSGSNSSSANSSKQNINHVGDNPLSSSSNKILSTSHQSDLNSYLSKRRNTTGSISFNKIVDLKNTSSGNTLKVASAVTAFSSSSSKLSTENIFQTVEDSDFFTTKQILQANEEIVNSYNEYEWCPLDIAIMLNNISMIQLLLHYGAEESTKMQPEENRYQSVCQQLSMLTEQNSDEAIKKSSLNKLTSDDNQLRRLSPSCDKQQRHRRTSKGQQQQLNQQRTLTLSQMKDNYEQSGKNHK